MRPHCCPADSSVARARLALLRPSRSAQSLETHDLHADSADSSPDVSDGEWECDKQHQHAAEAVAGDSSSVATYDCPVCRKPQILNLDRLQVGRPLYPLGPLGGSTVRPMHLDRLQVGRFSGATWW